MLIKHSIRTYSLIYCSYNVFRKFPGYFSTEFVIEFQHARAYRPFPGGNQNK
jgi:hypothetical protein